MPKKKQDLETWILQQDLSNANFMIVMVLFCVAFIDLVLLITCINIVVVAIIAYVTVGGVIVEARFLGSRRRLKRRLKK